MLELVTTNQFKKDKNEVMIFKNNMIFLIL